MDKIPQHLLPMTTKINANAVNRIHHVFVAPGVTPDMAINPNFYAHLAQRMTVMDEVIVHAKDGSFRLHAEVMAIDPEFHWASVVTLNLRVGGDIVLDANDPNGYRINHSSVQGWRILRGRDLVDDGLPDEAAARAKVAELQAKGEPPPMNRKVA